MSNKAQAPKGYGNKTLQQLTQESQQLLFNLGQAAYNEEFSRREQDRIQEELEEMEHKIQYAKRAEDVKAVEDNNKKVREENAASKEDSKSNEGNSSQETSGGNSDEAVLNTGA